MPRAFLRRPGPADKFHRGQEWEWEECYSYGSYALFGWEGVRDESGPELEEFYQGGEGVCFSFSFSFLYCFFMLTVISFMAYRAHLTKTIIL